MKIEVEFLNPGYNPWWEDRIQTSAANASVILSNATFLEKVRTWPKFDFCDDTPAQVAAKLASLTTVKIKVGFYYKRWTYAIAYEQDGEVWINTRKLGAGAGSPGNIAHEVQHAIGYSHNGNFASGNQNTEPYRIGNWVDGWADQPKVGLVKAFLT